MHHPADPPLHLAPPSAAPTEAAADRDERKERNRPASTDELPLVPDGQPSWSLRRDRPARVLVVEDEEALRRSFGDLVRELGCEVDTARDGMEAMRKAGRFLPHVVLLDIRLPALDGPEVCRALRAKAGTAETTIIGMSGFAGAEAPALAAGCDAFVAKPIMPDQLRALLARYLAGGRGPGAGGGD